MKNITDTSDSIGDARRKAIKDYITFMDVHVIHPPKDVEPMDVAKLDKKRAKLHDKICEAYTNEKYFEKSDLGDIRRRLLSFDSLSKNLELFDNDIDEVVEYYYLYNEDKVNSCYSNRIETWYGLKSHIDRSIADVKKTVKREINRCKKIIDAYDKARDAHNEKRKWEDNDYCHRYFDHEQNRASSYIDTCLSRMEQMAKMPLEAYLQPVVKLLYKDPHEAIFKEISALRANAFACMEYWKYESGFWDKDFEF